MANQNLKEIERATYVEMIDGRNIYDELKGLSVAELKQIVDRDRFQFDILAFNLTGDGNIGSIVRSAICHGAGKVFVFGRRTYDRRSSVGAENYIDVERVNGFKGDSIEFDVDAFKEILTRGNYFPVFVEQGGEDLQNFKWSYNENLKKTLVVVGNETNGIPQSFIDEFKGESAIVSIPQRGVLRSFNVSNALNMVVWDLRVKRGLF